MRTVWYSERCVGEARVKAFLMAASMGLLKAWKDREEWERFCG